MSYREGSREGSLCHAQAIYHPDGIAALASGEGPAIGAVDALLNHKPGLPLDTIIRSAVQIGCKRDRYSDGEPLVLTLDAAPAPLGLIIAPL